MEDTFTWNESAVKEIIRQTIGYLLTHDHVSIESVYDSIKKDYDEWLLMDKVIEKHQDYINEQTNAIKTINAKWGESADMENSHNVEIDGMKMSISVTKAK
ncbi:MAG: hypothetical protein [Wendovervirus sonii]|uniref:Uncharacterized protein n=1 Tax=phage Lak_Megaphage_Sonny TaxID=3109229 RepID=A0ABZ0Z6T6_9CAUD|nr:MAG: hypothetical protein [phage Lak_Megaphage_Sonny]